MIDQISIKSANYLKDYTLELTFSDGKVTNIEFEPFLKKSNKSNDK